MTEQEHVERAREYEAVLGAIWNLPHNERVTDHLQNEFAACAAAAARRAFERTREACAKAVDSMRSGRDWGGGFELFEADERGIGASIRALTFEQVMGGEK